MKNIVFYYIRRIKEKYRIRKARKILNLSNVTLLSQNCIGGVMYHDCNVEFLSPTINLYMEPSDFISFVNNMELFLCTKPTMTMGENYPVGCLEDQLKINFMHYKTEEEALTKWETRKERIVKDRIFVICIERDGFKDEHYKAFKKIKYPKALFTIRKELKNDPECIYIAKFRKGEEMPDIIPGRYMYYNNRLPKLIKKAFDE